MQKSSKARYFILGMLITAIISSTIIPAFASTVTKQLNAVFRDIKIVVDGEQIVPKDANGNIVEPFIVDGTTYLPVRAVGDALGKTVKWDSETSTVYVGEQPKVESSKIRVTVGGVELKTYPDSIPTDKLVHVYTLNNTNSFIAAATNESEIQALGFAIVRLNAGQTPVWRTFGTTTRENGEISGGVSFTQLTTSYLPTDQKEDFMSGYVYEFIVKAQMQNGTFTDVYTYRFMMKDSTYIEPAISVTYGDDELQNNSSSPVKANADLVITANHRAGVEYLIYYWDNYSTVQALPQSSLTFSSEYMNNFTPGTHYLFVNALASTAESTQGTDTFPNWLVYAFTVDDTTSK